MLTRRQKVGERVILSEQGAGWPYFCSRLCHGADVWPAARHLTFPCFISPVCGMAGTPLTCLQAWWEVLYGMKVAHSVTYLVSILMCVNFLFYFII